MAAVFVLAQPGSPTIIGYYTLSSLSIEPTSLPAAFARKLPRYQALPAVLLGRLAVDQQHRRQGWGEVLLVDALERAFVNTREVGAVAVVVDAKDDAARAFYDRYGFEPLLEQGMRLYLPMGTIEQLLGTKETD